MARIETKKLDDLLPDPNNINKHTQRGHALVENSIRRRGVGRGILAAGKNTDKPVIMAGNLTHEKARDAGIDEVVFVHTTGNQLVVTVRDDLDPTSAEAIALGIEDNESAKQSHSPDIDLLAAMTAGDNAVLAALKREDRVFGGMLEGMGVKDNAPQDAEPQIDRATELLEKWKVEPGDLWQIGAHRLLCGSSLDAENVARLFGDLRARLIWTDPPYGVNYGEKMENSNPMGYRVRTIENDDLPPEELEVFIRTALKNAADFSVPGAAIYVASPAGTLLPSLIRAFDGSGFDFRWGLIWLKDQIVLSRADYHFKHENILYGWKSDGAHFFIDDRKQNSVFEYPRPKRSDEHPTMKPVELVVHMIRNSSERGDVVYDCFGGSGTTGEVAKAHGRNAILCELNPEYVSLAYKRNGLTPEEDWGDLAPPSPMNPSTEIL